MNIHWYKKLEPAKTSGFGQYIFTPAPLRSHLCEMLPQALNRESQLFLGQTPQLKGVEE